MTKIYYNNLEIRNNLLPQLNTCRNKLNVILNELNNMSIPYDFNYKGYLIGLRNNIDGYIKKIKFFESKIDFTNKEFTKVMDEFETSYSSIQKENINKRSSLIK